MKVAEIKELTSTEIEERLAVETENLSRMKLNHAISPLDNPMQIKAIRRGIARLNTELRRRELNETITN
ncbi:MAG: 50S ribosomal protein L29 [Prevotellaceae bacterium]|jgi:large subunit ribosomal protein L29|nr:50S ribosomal protein L29 [Prevotellaceae bacterium]